MKLVRVLLFLGIVVVVIAAYSTVDTYLFVQSASRAPGVVVRTLFGKGHVEVQFEPTPGQRETFIQNGFVDLGPDESVEILFDPANSNSSARVNSVGALWFLPIILGGIGAGLIIASLQTRQHEI